MTTPDLIDDKRWRCKECDTISHESKLLTADNPFKRDESITGCPSCFSIDSFMDVCDQSGCEKDVSSGWPSPGGYRRTCHKHNKSEPFKL